VLARRPCAPRAGGQLRDDAEIAARREQRGYDAAKQATAALEGAGLAARANYGDFRAAARLVFRRPAERAALSLVGAAPRDAQHFLTLARASYTAAEAEPYQSDLARYGYPRPILDAALTTLDAYSQAGEAHSAAVGAAEHATDEREAAVDALRIWVGVFRRIAKSVLRTRAQRRRARPDRRPQSRRPRLRRRRAACCRPARAHRPLIGIQGFKFFNATISPESFQRGQVYYRDGAITQAAIQGNILTGECEGTQAPYYHIRVELDEAGIRTTSCSCPYEFGGYCKHIVALLLTYVQHPKRFVTRRAPDELLADLSRDDLVALVTKLLREQPDLYDRIEGAIAVPASGAKTKGRRRKQVDASVYRRQIRSILHSLDGMRASEAYWHVGGLAGTTWRKLRPGVMARLQKSHDDMVQAQVFLFEEEWGEAIRVAERRDVWYQVAETVADGVAGRVGVRCIRNDAHAPIWRRTMRVKRQESMFSLFQVARSDSLVP
jgi:hypothetical protein